MCAASSPSIQQQRSFVTRPFPYSVRTSLAFHNFVVTLVDANPTVGTSTFQLSAMLMHIVIFALPDFISTCSPLNAVPKRSGSTRRLR